jgi:hypothetical protein
MLACRTPCRLLLAMTILEMWGCMGMAECTMLESEQYSLAARGE